MTSHLNDFCKDPVPKYTGAGGGVRPSAYEVGMGDDAVHTRCEAWHFTVVCDLMKFEKQKMSKKDFPKKFLHHVEILKYWGYAVSNLPFTPWWFLG